MPKSPKKQTQKSKPKRKSRRNLLLIPASALIIKIFIIVNIEGFDWYLAGEGNLANGLKLLLDNNYIPPNAWYGADGENYIEGLRGLAETGFFSEEGKLSYWPAGYPLLMWPVLELFRGSFFFVIATLQSVLYFLGSAWLVDELRKTRVAKVIYLVAILLAFNPTLSLNTISIGYELPVVSLSLISLAAFLHYATSNRNSLFTWEIVVASLAFALSTFMQPRIFLLAFAFFIVWALAIYSRRWIPIFLVITLGIVSMAPAILIFRNQQVHGYTAISTNLGVTMKLGAGPRASGGYSNKAEGVVQCPSTGGDAAAQDAATVRCVIHWYLKNPATSFKLFWNKARFFWSPWFGPEANGTMARNPWNQNHPLKSIIQSDSGFNMVYGGFGRFISWVWMIFGLMFLLIGINSLWKLGGVERALALLAGSTFFLNLFSSTLTIGDHRFRIPSMGMTILLQSIGFMEISRKRLSNLPNGHSSVSWSSLRKAVADRTPSTQ